MASLGVTGMALLNAKQIKALYDRGENVMRALRESEQQEVNSRTTIQVAYDLQAGSYVDALKDSARRTQQNRYAAAVAEVLDRYRPGALMEAGVGEATTLANVVKHLHRQPEHVLGFDLSWSRIAVGERFLKQQELQAELFVGELEHIPVADGSVDMVFTSHAIEPNRGREKAILSELFRVSRRYLVLLEPSNELGTAETRRHIEEHRYCQDLRRHAEELGFAVVEHRLMEHVSNPRNQTALLIVAKDPAAETYDGRFLGCPRCHTVLESHKGNYWCPECLTAYPVLGGIPCLLEASGILATRYLELS